MTYGVGGVMRFPGVRAPRGRVRVHPAMPIETLRDTRRGWTRPAPAETTSFGLAQTLYAQVGGEGQAGRGKHSAGQKLPNW